MMCTSSRSRRTTPFEVVSAVRYDDSGGYLILQARSRHGLFSRNAKYPFADICGAIE